MNRATAIVITSMTYLASRDTHEGPDALVWAAGRQPGGSLLRDSRLPNWQLVIIPVCFHPMRHHSLAMIPEAELRSAGQTRRLPLREAAPLRPSFNAVRILR